MGPKAATGPFFGLVLPYLTKYGSVAHEIVGNDNMPIGPM